MVLKTNLELQKIAQNKKYAVGAFNIYNLETIQSVVAGAIAQNSPAMLTTSEGAIKYAGLKNIKELVYNHCEKSKINFSLHLDHGTDLETIKECIKIGYTSVMIDASAFEFEKNIKITKKVVALAHKKQVSVEAELGTLSGVEDNIKSEKIIYTDPVKAKEFIEKTGCDTLAIAIGTSHGAYKFTGSAKLRIDILQDIKKKINTPLVLHGASGVPKEIVELANKYGAKLGNAKGVPDQEIIQAIKNGISKINIDTDSRISFTAGVRKVLTENPSEFDPRKIMGPAKELMQKTIEQKMILFGSSKKA